jgi:F-type H+-transporting ATPase subunit gamma
LADIRTIRRRIRGVQSIAKITRAMEMIATSKMRYAQERGIAGRPYAEKIRQVIADLEALPHIGELHPLLQRREIKKIEVLHITPDRGLAGGLVGAINRKVTAFKQEQTVPLTMVVVGKKGLSAMQRLGMDIRAEFTGLGDRPSYLATLPISRVIIDDFQSGAVDAVYVTYTKFQSTMVQTPVIEQILPVEPATVTPGHNVDYIYESGPAAVLASLLPRFVEMQVFHAVLEAIASEQSARMLAMRNATESAGALVEELTLVYNKARQEAITRELLDITSGADAISK